MINLKKIFALGLIIVLINACTAPKEPEIRRIEDIKVVSMTGQLITVEANVVLYNPNPISMELTGATIDVMVNEIQAATIDNLANTEIPSDSEKKVPLTVSFPPNKILKLNNLGDLFNMVAKKTAKISYKGEIKVKAIGMTFKVPVEKEQEVNLK